MSPAPTPAPGLRLLRTLALSLAGWTLVAAAIAKVIHLGQPHLQWISIFVWTLPTAACWGFATPAILALARRFRSDLVSPTSFLAAHLTAAAMVHFASAGLEWWLRPWLRPSTAGAPLGAALVDGIVFDVTRYFVLVAGVHAFEFHALYLRKEREALELRANLVEAQLATLRMQLQPHFLFNALHAISELVYRDARLADRAITRLADLLRGSLDLDDSREIPLARELALLDAYLEIQKLRAGDALELAFHVEPSAKGHAIPGFLLQPLVENALRHGIHGRPNGSVAIAARIRDGWLEITVENDGASPQVPLREGIGLRSTRARLHTLYGNNFEFHLGPRPGGGAIARVKIPARAMPHHAEAARAQAEG